MNRHRDLPQLDEVITLYEQLPPTREPRVSDQFGRAPIPDPIPHRIWAKRFDMPVVDQTRAGGPSGTTLLTVYETRFLMRRPAFEVQTRTTLEEADGTVWNVTGVAEAGIRGSHLWLLVEH